MILDRLLYLVQVRGACQLGCIGIPLNRLLTALNQILTAHPLYRLTLLITRQQCKTLKQVFTGEILTILLLLFNIDRNYNFNCGVK